MKTNPLLNETFVFRPIGQVNLRYANGEWIPDDGEPDMAFIGHSMAYYVSMPYQTNILWSWMDGEAVRKLVGERLRFDANPWHYYTIDNEPWYDYHWGERDKHPNEIAGRQAMSKCCSIHHVANGRGADLIQDSEYIKQGKLWIQRTMELVKPPANPVCFLCLDGGKGHILNALRSRRSKHEFSLEDAKENYSKALGYEEDIDYYTNQLKDLEYEIAEMNAQER